MSIKLLLNNKEIANFLNSNVDVKRHVSEFQLKLDNTEEVINWMKTGIRKKGLKNIDADGKRKYKDRLIKGVTKDLREYYDAVSIKIQTTKESNWNTIHKKLDHILDSIGEQKVLDLYKKSSKIGFVKGCGLNIDPKGILIRRHRFTDYTGDCLIRNTVGNEELLVTKIDKSFPFWFIDSGYTNFLEPNKKWHRLVRNHLHCGNYFHAPADRLDIFKSFPKPWRDGGDIIYVIEPGPFAAQIFHVDLKTWKYDVEAELRKYTDKKIIFREKAPKRERTNLYKELADENYYCIVSINSNAATEAIWQGVPAITLDRHITNPVTVNKLSDVNNLFRESIGNWLCMLSYSQFTYEEIVNGTALKFLSQYYE